VSKLIAVSLLLLATPVTAQDKPARTETANDRAKAAAEAGVAIAPVDEQLVSRKDAVTVGGRRLPYVATAGTLTLRDTEGRPQASMFYTAYTLDGAKPGSKRPVTFFYNGGPGSPSFWLHMGSFAPVRLRTGNPEFIRPAPYDFGPNPDTLLDKTDMVFLDAIGAGYSRPLGDTRPSGFYGVDEDADIFAKAILRYTTKFGRWNSPKFMLGDSRSS
jgi:carboxypeptidase C (cathepsin A)